MHKPPRSHAKKDARDLISKKRKAPLPKEDARHLLNKIKPLKEDARTKLLQSSAQVGYYTESFVSKSHELSGYKLPKVSAKTILSLPTKKLPTLKTNLP